VSVELFVYFDSQDIPSPSDWSNALAACEFDIRIDAPLSLRDQSGFMPVYKDQKRTGFEFHIGDAEEVDDLDDLELAIEDCDAEAVFRFSREDEYAAAMPCALVFAKITNGIFYDPQDELILETAHEIDCHIESCKPSYWLRQDPQLKKAAAPGQPKFRDAIATLYEGYLKTSNEVPEEFATLLVAGVPLLDLMVLPLVGVEKLATGEGTAEEVLLLGQSVRAINKVLSKSSVGEAKLKELRALLIAVLKEMGFEFLN